MSTALISGLIGAAAATLIASYFGNKPAEISGESGRRRLFYALGLRVIINLVVVILVIGTVRALIHQPDDTAVHVFMILFTVFAGGFLVVETHFSSIEYDYNSIFVRTLWRQEREIPWADYESIRQRPFLSMHTIYTKSNGRIAVYDVMSGASELVERARWQGRRIDIG